MAILKYKPHGLKKSILLHIIATYISVQLMLVKWLMP